MNFDALFRAHGKVAEPCRDRYPARERSGQILSRLTDAALKFVLGILSHPAATFSQFHFHNLAWKKEREEADVHVGGIGPAMGACNRIQPQCWFINEV